VFAIERIVIYSLRATQARNATKRLSPGLLTYQQISFGLGYIGIANDMINIIRCMLVNTTFSIETYYQAPASKDAPLIPKDGENNIQAYHKGSGEFLISGWQRERFTGKPREGDPDYAKRRATFRRLTGIAGLLFLAATVPGIIAHQHFGNLLKNTSQANSDYKLRYASSAVALLFILLTAAATVWAYVKLPRVRPKAVSMMLAICTLMTVISIYRLSVMYNWTDSESFLSTGPNTLNSSGAKAAFYILHALPEWLATVLLFSTNVRMVFGTGLFGDWRRRDETAEERAKREEKERRKAEKKAANAEKK